MKDLNSMVSQKLKKRAIKKITDHKVVEVVTFSFFLFFNFSVNNPPIQ